MPIYQVDHVPGVTSQIEGLHKLATERGLRTELDTAVSEIMSHLERDPIPWGDAERNTRAGGGFVLHAIHWGLFVHYVAFPSARAVTILNIYPVIGSPLLR